MYTLGVYYHEGVGTPKDDAKALEWLRKVANYPYNSYAKKLIAEITGEGT